MIYQIGQDAHFVAFSNGIVGDRKTELQWFASSHYEDWGMARWGIEKLKLGGGQWRMPSIEELKSLFYEGPWGLNFSGLLMNHFTASDIQQREYTAWRAWSCETIVEGEEKKALCYIFPKGRVAPFRCSDHCGRWFAVRRAINMDEIPQDSASDDNTSFEVMHDGDLILFNDFVISNILWKLDWYVGPDHDMTGNEARAWVNRLDIRGGGWRLPEYNELKRIYQYGRGDRNISHLFKTKGWFIWTRLQQSDLSCRFYLFNGMKFLADKGEAFNCRVFAVRETSM